MHWIFKEHSVFPEACWTHFRSLPSPREHGSALWLLKWAQWRGRSELRWSIISAQASSPLFPLKWDHETVSLILSTIEQGNTSLLCMREQSIGCWLWEISRNLSILESFFVPIQLEVYSLPASKIPPGAQDKPGHRDQSREADSQAPWCAWQTDEVP